MKQLGQIGDTGHNGAGGGGPGIHTRGAEQNNKRNQNRGQKIDNRIDEGKHRHDENLGGHGGGVSLAEFGHDVQFPDTGLDYSDPGKVLLQQRVDPVNLGLEDQIARCQFHQKPAQHPDNNRECNQHGEPESRIEHKHKEDTSGCHERGSHQTAGEHRKERLHLGDISGKTVYQSAGTGSVYTAEGIAHNRAVAGLAQFIANPVGRHIHKHSVQGAAKTSEQCNQDHPDPVIDNKSQIAVAAA